MTFLKHLIGLFYVTGVDATVVFGAERIQAGNRKVLAERLRSAVVAQFIPVVKSSERNLQVADADAGKLKLVL
jgi:hypothetical protein